MSDCLFCNIVAGQLPCHTIYETDFHIAILDIFPSTKSQTLVLPKAHLPSDVFKLDEQSYIELFRVAKEVANLIDEKLAPVRTFLVAEGMEVPHAHLKLYPTYKIVQNISDLIGDMFEYKGYLTTAHGRLASEESLLAIVKALSSPDPTKKR